MDARPGPSRTAGITLWGTSTETRSSSSETPLITAWPGLAISPTWTMAVGDDAGVGGADLGIGQLLLGLLQGGGGGLDAGLGVLDVGDGLVHGGVRGQLLVEQLLDAIVLVMGVVQGGLGGIQVRRRLGDPRRDVPCP